MLRFLFGRAGSGKTTEIMRQIGQLLDAGEKVTLIVPEQYTFETERAYFEAFGGKAFAKLQITGFTRLAKRLFEKHGINPGILAGEAVQTVFMSLALDEVRDDLAFYQKAAGHLSFAREVLKLSKEFKTSACSIEQRFQTVHRLPQGMLRDKMDDLTKITAVYEGLLGDRYHDEQDDLEKLCALLQEDRVFEHRHVFIDSFHGYTGQELALIAILLKQSKDCTVSLCLDPNANTRGLFAPSFLTRRRLEDLARQHGVRIAKPQVLEGTKRFASGQLAFLEEHIMQTHQPFAGKLGAVHLVMGDQEHEEARFCAATVRQLVEEGYRYGDIAVLSRDLETYRLDLLDAFRKNNIPYYLDQKQVAAEHPLLRLVHHALDAAAEGITSEKLLTLLKCGFSPFAVEEIAAFENYCFLWQLSLDDWKQPFLFSPFGIQGARGEQQAAQEAEWLERFNTIRCFAFEPLVRLREALRSRQAKRAGEGLLRFLEEFGVREAINQRMLAFDLQNSEQVTEASVYRQLWQILQESAQTLMDTLGNRPIEPKRYAELFGMLLGEVETGSVPQSMDCVLIGEVQRTRMDAQKVLLILGVNDQVFPYVPKNDSLLNDRDRAELKARTGMELSKSAEEHLLEERFLAYQTMATPSEQLYLVARRADRKGKAIAPSRLFLQIERLFGEAVKQDISLLDPLYFCRTEQTVFEEMTRHYREDTPCEATLKEAVRSFDGGRSFLHRVEELDGRRRLVLTDHQAIQALYGKRVVVSPSRIETYETCAFRYFCEYGMGLRPREQVQLSASVRGSLVHDILCVVCRQITDYSHFDREAIAALVEEALAQFLGTMGGEEHQSNRMLFLCARIKEEALQLLERLFSELGLSSFHPCAFEYKIGGKDGAPPYLFTSEEGFRIAVQGTIDRVDEYIGSDGKRYLRVIDYKTGVKDFSLSDLYNGINLQLFLYLMCFDQHQTAGLSGLSAGGLYMAAGTVTDTLDRHGKEEDAQQMIMNYYRLKGIVLDDAEIVRAMEPNLNGTYTTIELKKAGFTKEGEVVEDWAEGKTLNHELFTAASAQSLLTDPQMKLVFSHIEALLEQMVYEVYHGNIEPKPLVGKNDSCAFCRFGTICGYRKGDPAREYRKIKKEEWMQELLKGKE